MDIETRETLGLGQMVEKVAELTRDGAAGYGLITLPKEALPPGLVVADPTLLITRDGKGQVKLERLAPHLDELRGKPARRKGTAQATTLESFCALVNRNGDDDTVIFVDADWRKPKLTAVLNYHREAPLDPANDQPKAAEAGDDPLARFGDHRIVYAFPLSEPWKLWIAQNGQAMSQADFAAFLEEHIHEIAGPDTDNDQERRWEEDFRTKIAQPNELIDLARGLEVLVGHKIKTQTRLQTGETSLVFETDHVTQADGNQVTVPGLFMLRIPIFYRGLPQRILVRLRYRAAGEKGVLWFYDIFRPDEVVDERVRADVEEARHLTGREVIDGSPEA